MLKYVGFYQSHVCSIYIGLLSVRKYSKKIRHLKRTCAWKDPYKCIICCNWYEKIHQYVSLRKIISKHLMKTQNVSIFSSLFTC